MISICFRGMRWLSLLRPKPQSVSQKSESTHAGVHEVHVAMYHLPRTSLRCRGWSGVEVTRLSRFERGPVVPCCRIECPGSRSFDYNRNRCKVDMYEGQYHGLAEIHYGCLQVA